MYHGLVFNLYSYKSIQGSPLKNQHFLRHCILQTEVEEFQLKKSCDKCINSHLILYIHMYIVIY